MVFFCDIFSHSRDIQVKRIYLSDDIISGYGLESNHKIKNISKNIEAYL